MSDGNRFLETVLNSPDKVKKYLIECGMKGKSTAPISFFREEDREKFIRKNTSESGGKPKSKKGGKKQ